LAAADWKKTVITLVLLGVMFGGLALSAKFLPLADWLKVIEGQVSALGPWAGPAFVVLFAVGCILLLPTTLVVAGAGATLGLWPGFFAVWFGYIISSWIVWEISRWFAGPVRARLGKIHPSAPRMLEAVEKRGTWLVLLTQLHPLTPAGILNYCYRSLGLKRLPTLIAIALGRAPTLWLYAALGAWSSHTVSGRMQGPPWLAPTLLIGGLAIFGVMAWLVTKVTHEALKAESAA